MLNSQTCQLVQVRVTELPVWTFVSNYEALSILVFKVHFGIPSEKGRALSKAIWLLILLHEVEIRLV
jgi:hypothetical protein